ncbi:MAG: hypothetical protein KF741_03455 [Ferruginibacter sp.]|nr:hypothetical protein [Bacteroidota bacterium]MBX2918278.1 hypothetical protein [Ferruginibacter sp.]MCC7380057.1 hypothetical protein [Chitinophagaceae bacterium]
MAKNKILILGIIIMQVLNSCSKSGIRNIAPSGVILDSGTVVFYSDDNSVYDIDVMLNNNYVGSLKTTISGIPECGTNGTITLRCPVGDYGYTGMIKGDVLWNGKISVEKDGCKKVFFNKQGDNNLIIGTPVDSFFSFRLNNTPLSFKYPWWGHLYADGLTSSQTQCDPYLGLLKLFFRAHNQYKEPFPMTVPSGTCTGGPGGNNTNVELHLKMTNRPVTGQQYTSCDGKMYFRFSISEQSNYGYYGVVNPGDYITITITNVTGLTISGTFQGSLTRYKTQNCQTIILGRGEITNGVFKTKYKFN